jgi:hypothetical protein
MLTSLTLIVASAHVLFSRLVQADPSWGGAATCFSHHNWAIDGGPEHTKSNCDPDGFCSGGVDTIFLTVWGAGIGDDQNGEYTIHYDPAFPPGWIDDGSAPWELGSAANPNCIMDLDGDATIWSYELDVNEFSCTIALYDNIGVDNWDFVGQGEDFTPMGPGYKTAGNLGSPVGMVCFYCWGDNVYSPNC